MIKLIATDMDGTLLDGNGYIPAETYSLIDRLREEGIHLCVCSGRSLETLERSWGEYASKISFVASHGTQVSCEGKTLLDEIFDREVICKLKNLCDRLPFAHLVLHGKKTSYVFDRNWVRPAPPRGEEVPMQYVDDVPDDEFYKVLVLLDDPSEGSDTVYFLNHELGGRIDPLLYSPICIDVTPYGVSKASALKVLAEHLRIVPEEIVAYGDEMNDYEMFRYVGHPVAPVNARSILRACAERVIESNVDHGVQRDLERILGEAGQSEEAR